MEDERSAKVRGQSAAREQGTDPGTRNMAEVGDRGAAGHGKNFPGLLDANVKGKPHYRHHPIIGLVYDPGTRLIVPRPDGGSYKLIVNSEGVRSDREYSHAKPPGVYRILVFGDSHAGGLFQSNKQRFSELLEQRFPGLEVINFSTPGTGTDQQLLAFKEMGRQYEHDLVMLMPFLMNIRRNVAWSLPTRNPNTGLVVYRPKPRFELVTHLEGGEELVLRNVPIPEEPPGSERVAEVNAKPSVAARIARSLRSTRRLLSPVRLVKRGIFPLLGWLGVDPFPLLRNLGYEVFPEYSSPDTEEWALMAAIIRRFGDQTKPKPFVIAPLVNSSYMRFSVGREYWSRFTSLADGERVHVIDVLPHFLALGRKAIRCYLEPRDPHLSDLGHSVLADAVEAELRRLKLLPDPSKVPHSGDAPPCSNAGEARSMGPPEFLESPEPPRDGTWTTQERSDRSLAE